MNRLVYNKWQELTNQYGIENVSQGTLKLITETNTTLSEFSFETLANVGTTLDGESRLQLKDKFCITHVGFAISNVASGGAIANTIPVTFPNENVLTASVATNLQAVYNGTLSFKVGNIEYIDDIDMRRFYSVPTSQNGVGDATGVTGIPADEFHAGQGYIPMFPLVTIDGQQDINWKVTLAASTDLTGDSSSTNYAHLYLQGFKVTRS